MSIRGAEPGVRYEKVKLQSSPEDGSAVGGGGRVYLPHRWVQRSGRNSTAALSNTVMGIVPVTLLCLLFYVIVIHYRDQFPCYVTMLHNHVTLPCYMIMLHYRVIAGYRLCSLVSSSAFCNLLAPSTVVSSTVLEAVVPFSSNPFFAAYVFG